MSINQGQRIAPVNFKEQVPRPNMVCLLTWMSVGADVENGKYAMLGARMGCWQTITHGFELIEVRELEHIIKMFDNIKGDPDELIQTYGNSLRQKISIPIADYNAEDSRFFKFCQPQWINKGVQDREQKSL